MNDSEVNDAIKRFQGFLRQLTFGDDVTCGWTDEPFALFTQEDLTVTLRGHNAEAFESMVDVLYGAIERVRPIAKATVSRLASECVMRVARFDHAGSSSSDFETLLDTISKELRKSLSAPDVPWRFVLPIGGLAPSGLPMTVGQVEFKFADQQTIEHLKNQAKFVHSLKSASGSNPSTEQSFADALGESFHDAVSKFENCAVANR